MQTPTIIFTYDDYLTLPNDGKRYEIIDGDLHITPAPIPEHQLVLVYLTEILLAYLRSHKWGKLFVAPTDVVFSMTEVAQPDIAVVARERDHIITKRNIIAAPDLIVEILSEATEKTDRTTKKAMYERHGVKEYWIVDPSDRSVEIFELVGGAYAPGTRFASTEEVHSPLLSGLSFRVQTIFDFE